MAYRAAETEARHMLTGVPVNELQDLIELGKHPDSVIPELIMWQAQKVLHSKTGKWE